MRERLQQLRVFAGQHILRAQFALAEGQQQRHARLQFDQNVRLNALMPDNAAGRREPLFGGQK